MQENNNVWIESTLPGWLKGSRLRSGSSKARGWEARDWEAGDWETRGWEAWDWEAGGWEAGGWLLLLAALAVGACCLEPGRHGNWYSEALLIFLVYLAALSLWNPPEFFLVFIIIGSCWFFFLFIFHDLFKQGKHIQGESKPNQAKNPKLNCIKIAEHI